MNTATKGKWFYEFQQPIIKAIEETYEIKGYIVHQTSDKDNYMECWNVRRKDNGKLTQIIATVYRHFAVHPIHIFERQY
jgi:hypothetical protein